MKDAANGGLFRHPTIGFSAVKVRSPAEGWSRTSATYRGSPWHRLRAVGTAELRRDRAESPEVLPAVLSLICPK
jgi:hypothetical protein